MKEVGVHNAATAIFIALVLLLITVSIPFVARAQSGPETYPIPGWRTAVTASSWLSNGGIYNHYNSSNAGYNPYSTAPNTPHILWTNKLGIGGISGYPGSPSTSILSMVAPVVVLDGRVYCGYQGAIKVLRCLDAFTGKQIWSSEPNFTGRAFTGYMMDIVFAYEAVGRPTFPMLFSYGTLLDVESGAIITTYKSPITGGTLRLCDISNGYVYYTNGSSANPSVYCYSLPWNVGEIGELTGGDMTYVWGPTSGASARCLYNGVLLASAHTNDAIAGMNATTGQLLWSGHLGVVPTQESSAGYGEWLVEGTNGILYAFNPYTGTSLWNTSKLFTYGSVGIASAYGNHYMGSYNGTLYCLASGTGKILWTFDDVSYLQRLGYTLPTTYQKYGGWPFNEAPIAADGKVYADTGDHEAPNPMVPGEREYCLNGTTGDVLWSYPCSGGDNHPSAIANGILFVPDQYTGQLIAFGKGPTAVTASVSESQIASGSSVWISGNVTDQSAGQAGTPCVSNASMGAWMEYLHAGMDMPSNVTGVPVTLSALYSNNTQVEIGTVTTDSQGHFQIKWTPSTEDHYRIVASFKGDDSYYDSTGTAELTVGSPAQDVVGQVVSQLPSAVVAQLPETPAITTAEAIIIAAVVVTVILTVYNIAIVRKLRK